MSDATGGIGTRIAEVRRFANLSQVQLAEQLGISKPGLANYERGVRVPPASLVVDLCVAHKIDPAWLLTGRGSMLEKDLDELHTMAVEVAWQYLARGGDDVQQDHLVKLSSALFQYLMLHDQLDDDMTTAMGKLVA
jgi:transcriptional regulator with XRE-family HTH domain